MSLFNVYRGFPVSHVWRRISAFLIPPLNFSLPPAFSSTPPPVAPCLQVTAPLFAVLRCHVPCQGDNAHPRRGLFGMLLCTLQIHTKPDIYISVTFFFLAFQQSCVALTTGLKGVTEGSTAVNFQKCIPSLEEQMLLVDCDLNSFGGQIKWQNILKTS